MAPTTCADRDRVKAQVRSTLLDHDPAARAYVAWIHVAAENGSVQRRRQRFGQLAAHAPPPPSLDVHSLRPLRLAESDAVHGSALR
jgi:hypothetical protein